MAPMQQIKFFRAADTELTGLEQTVNSWLAENAIRVVQVFGNLASPPPQLDTKSLALSRGNRPPSDVLLVVVYEVEADAAPGA